MNGTRRSLGMCSVCVGTLFLESERTRSGRSVEMPGVVAALQGRD